jgi:hypothetical protein
VAQDVTSPQSGGDDGSDAGSYEILHLTSRFFISASGGVHTLLVMARVGPASPAQRRHIAVTRRDPAPTRLNGITAGIAAAAVRALGVYVAKALPGHDTTRAAGATASSGNTGHSGTGSGSANTLNAPCGAPRGVSLPTPLTSGSS